MLVLAAAAAAFHVEAARCSPAAPSPSAWTDLGRRVIAPALISGACLFGGADALSAAEFTPDQAIVAQAWQKTDRNFYDRTFAGQDWFKTRQSMVKKKYDSRDEAYAEVRKMLASLNDKYTRFLTPSMYSAIYAVATGDVAGIGVELAPVDPAGSGSIGAGDGSTAEVRVSSVVEGAPSELAGLQPGDVLVEVDGFGLVGLTPEEAAARIRGPVGSKMRLVVRRAGEAEPLVKQITRASVKLEAVTSSVESAGGQKVGYIRIKQFSTTTADDVKAALQKLGSASPAAYVLDLRGNTGGYFPGGVDVARLFLKEESPITYVVDKRAEVTSYTTFEAGAYASPPLLLLVDGNTASASEILSSALQDNKRATLVGSRTFGKAVIQTVEELDDGSAVVVTIASYQTPLKTNINQKGITVDVQRDCPPKAAEAVACVAGDLIRAKALVTS